MEYVENQVQYVIEDTISEIGHEAKRQVGKYVKKGRNKYRENRQERRAEKKSQKVDEALKCYDSDFDTTAYRIRKQNYQRGHDHVIK